MNYEVYGPYMPVIMMVVFFALFAWVLHPKNKSKYDDAANMPLNEPDDEPGNEASNGRIEK
ncbi:cbb3-type cytochrome oxidase subunit 3 [Pontibacter sp. JAM-7]|uniref:cbb3-type cytochrome oxidase subunit 3 n=1 Tax=Pontibacter sp. JAM-7 TaxID=3366581 RepID=UPI003AF463D3